MYREAVGDFFPITLLTAHNLQNEKEYSWYVSAIKFIGMKQLV